LVCLLKFENLYQAAKPKELQSKQKERQKKKKLLNFVTDLKMYQHLKTISKL
jgi:hypothetical protein